MSSKNDLLMTALKLFTLGSRLSFPVEGSEVFIQPQQPHQKSEFKKNSSLQRCEVKNVNHYMMTLDQWPWSQFSLNSYRQHNKFVFLVSDTEYVESLSVTATNQLVTLKYIAFCSINTDNNFSFLKRCKASMHGCT